jgi:tRNA pseudouridine38-40 synthase
MPRYKLTLEYEGGPFVGWQVQPSGLSVQGAVEDAIFKMSGERRRITAAGRTDAGVHALGQVAHVDLDKDWRPDTLRDALNFHVRPLPVGILSAEIVPDTFNARLSAKARHYRYRILNRRGNLTLDEGRAWRVPRKLDHERMAEAAGRLLGRHDFTTFRATECQAKSPIRTLDKLDVTRVGDEIRVEASARSFLHHQVRSMVGTLVYAGEGRWTADDVSAALAARDRTRCGLVAPPQGLYFLRVDY